MATKDTNTGLLSKVAKFVRNPTTNWSDLDMKEPEPEVGYSKQALKEMIERKRQNDFVRKREFDQLRRLRNRDPSASLEVAGRPSFYQSSLPSNVDERAVTLKKIDEIEAQMSKQWWKGKQAGPDDNANPSAAVIKPAEAGDTGSDSSNATTDPNADAHPDFALTQAGETAPPSSEVRPVTEFAATRLSDGLTGADGTPKTDLAAEGSGFSTSRLYSVELSDDNIDADLEEAAIRFANGDDAGAETGLLDALKGTKGQSRVAEIWTEALFDFYRATGQQAQFEGIAIDFAERFGRSAPAWFSMPGQLGVAPAPVAKNAVVEEPAEQAIWVSPASLDAASMDELHLALANAPLPWHLNWQPLTTVQPDALSLLGQLFSSWCTLRVRLRFEGAQALEKALGHTTPSGDKTVSAAWWQLRMDALRIMRMQDEFELVALDYCVTYEVSPPAWQDARCGYVQEDKAAAITQTMVPSGADSGQAYTVLMGLEDTPAVVVELAGEIVGDAADALQRLEVGRHQGAGRLVVSCARLIRVDFSAAGSILNWVANRENEGCQVQFRDVHRLVAAFFNVIGINEHARVVLRAH